MTFVIGTWSEIDVRSMDDTVKISTMNRVDRESNIPTEVEKRKNDFSLLKQFIKISDSQQVLHSCYTKRRAAIEAKQMEKKKPNGCS